MSDHCNPILWLVLCASAAHAEPPVVVVDRDNVTIDTTCTVRVEAAVIVDTDGNGVVHVSANDITVDFAGAVLRGADEGRSPDTYQGTGITITGRNVTVRGAVVRGFKAGIRAHRAARLTIEDCDVSGNFRQRLRSTPTAEDPSDWLRPHDNDDNEWLTRYGAGVYLEECQGPIVRRVRAWGTQNGIILDRVAKARIYDNDCSFGSGWGLAMWRSNSNTISRNAFDFRIRGYSHGVYNRGQDSAGILMFEQCTHNEIVQNSATHCGDGFFGFSGREALGEVNPGPNLTLYRKRGHRQNVIAENDFSYAAAHGLELTFGYSNEILRNRLVGNAICGIWGGYSQASTIAGNVIEDNGDMPYGTERGGINIEHGSSNMIHANAFRNNACGVFMWWDRDPHILKLPWAKANRTAVESNSFIRNTFDGDRIGIQMRKTGSFALIGNTFTNVPVELDLDEISRSVMSDLGDIDAKDLPIDVPEAVGETSPVGARAHLRGREHIIMTEWGPYDWTAPLLRRVEAEPSRHVWELLGPEPPAGASIDAPGGVELTREADGRLVVSAAAGGSVLPYELTAETASGPLRAKAALAPVSWDVTFFPSAVDPRQDVETWRREGRSQGVRVSLPALDLPFGSGGPEDLESTADHFGTIATATVHVPAGVWRIRTTSDDGIRVWLDDDLVIDDWTWHPPKMHTYELELAEGRQITFRVEHFELDGYAILSLELEPIAAR